MEKKLFGEEKREKLRKTGNFEFQQFFLHEFSTWKSEEKRKKWEKESEFEKLSTKVAQLISTRKNSGDARNF